MRRNPEHHLHLAPHGLELVGPLAQLQARHAHIAIVRLDQAHDPQVIGLAMADGVRRHVRHHDVRPSAQQIGSVKSLVPLQQDVYTSRNEPSLLDAFKANPYTQSLQSSA